jgi:CRP-like cAMP-binding protein
LYRIGQRGGRIDQRLARWLLMPHDRSPGDSLQLTHDFLALMLGVRRAGVTNALHQLSAGGFYGAPERELNTLLEIRPRRDN